MMDAASPSRIMQPRWRTFICFMSITKHSQVIGRTKDILHFACFPIIYFPCLPLSLNGDVRDARVSTLIWHLPRRSRCFESGETLHKSNEEHVHRQTKCHQSDHLPGFRSKTETSRNLAHIGFLWRQRTKVMKSLTREAGEREREATVKVVPIREL